MRVALPSLSRCGAGYSCVLIFVLSITPLWAQPPGWQREEVNWRATAGIRVKAIQYPADVAPSTLSRNGRPGPAQIQRKALTKEQTRRSALLAGSTTQAAPAGAVAYVINSPPIDGFVPWIALAATDEDQYDDWGATPSVGVVGNYLVANPQTDYGIGLFDTGAGISVLNNATANTLNLFGAGYNTGGTIEISGVTGAVDAWVSQPYGLFMDGLAAIDPSTDLLDTTYMVGETNVSTALAQTPVPGAPEIATAIGSPMTVFFTAWFRNNVMHSLTHGSETYTAPDIQLFDLLDPAIPQYPNAVPLELRPSGAAYVWYWPCFAALEDCPGGDGSPKIPSFIIGASAQSLFFVGSVDLADNGNTSLDNDRFIIDTAAQITVVGNRVAARLGLNPNTPDFYAEVQGVDGQTVLKPGFYLDVLNIPALGDWLMYTNVPVVLVEVDSPEGGTLDGIIGMNLLTNYNFVLRGGGMSGQPSPSLEYALIPPVDADFDNDNDVDMSDFGHLQTCLTGRNVALTDPTCADANLDGDSDVDRQDVLLFIDCVSGPAVAPTADCGG